MKKSKILPIVLLLSLVSCGGKNKDSITSNLNSIDSDISSPISSDINIEEMYGEFKVTAANGGEYILDEENKTLTLTSLDTYTLTGKFEGSIIYSLDNTVAKGNIGYISLNECYIKSGTKNAILWTSSKGTLEIKAEKDTVNYLVSDGISGEKIQTIKGNNINIRGTGEMYVESKNHNAIKGQDVDIKSTNLNIKAAKNGISCENLTLKSGKINIEAQDRAISCQYKMLNETECDTSTGIFVTKQKEIGETLEVNIKGGLCALDVDNKMILGFGKIYVQESETLSSLDNYQITEPAELYYNGEKK